MALFDFNITLRLPLEFFTAVDRIVTAITTKGNYIMATLDELTQEVANVKTEVERFGPAVDAFEARITQILKDAGISAADQAKIDAAVADLKTVAGTAKAASDDAADGIDEAATPAP